MPNDRRQQFSTGALRFLGEQDGPPERELKKRLIRRFQNCPDVKTAYLANVTYGDQQAMNVALCLRADSGNEESVAKEVANIFASLFRRHEHLDIIFLSKEQEAALAGVCSAFFATK
jgi:hypothetical protein